VIIRLRIAMLALGVIAFMFALNAGVEWLRWIGVALVAAALLLRFLKT
jgi:hypothetical protein